MQHESVPNPKLIPEMIKSDEIPVLIRNEENAENNRQRRNESNEKKETRTARHRLTKFMAGVAIVGALGTALGVKEVNRANAGPSENHPEFIKVHNSRGIQGSVEFVPWEMATAAQKHAALVEAGIIQQEP